MKLSLSERVIQTLSINDRTIFGQILSLIPGVISMIDNGSIQTIFAPSDAKLSQILQYVKLTESQFGTSPEGQMVMANHCSKDDSSIGNSVASLTGNTIPLTQEYLLGIGASAVAIIDKIKVILIREIIITQEQINRLQSIVAIASRAPITTNPGVLGKLDRNNLSNLNQLGNVRGKDLIALCLSHPQMNQLCNSQDSFGRTMFHRLLKSEFGETFPGFQNVRDRYIRRHTSKFLIRDNQMEEPLKSEEGIVVDFMKSRRQPRDEPNLIGYRKIQSVYDLKSIIAVTEGHSDDRLYGITADGRGISVELEHGTPVGGTFPIPENYGKLIWVDHMADSIIFITNKLNVLKYNTFTKLWTAFENPGHEILDYVKNYDWGATFLTTNVHDNPPLQLKYFQGYFDVLTTRQLNLAAPNPKLVKLLDSGNYVLGIYQDDVFEPEYCLIQWHAIVFDSRKFPGGSFSFDKTKIHIADVMTDIDSDDKLPLFGILNDIGQLWIGHCKVNDMNIFWNMFKSPDSICDFMFQPKDRERVTDIYILERSGKCRYMEALISPEGILYGGTDNDRYYMHVPGLRSIQNHNHDHPPAYLEVADIF